MKKYLLLFAAGGLLTLASCGGDSTPAETTNVDSIAAVKADSIAAALKAQSDSTIAAEAQAKADSLTMVMKADSIAAAEAAKNAKSSTKKVVTKKPVNKTETMAPEPKPLPKEPETIGNGKPKLNESKDNNTIGNGKPKLK